MVINLKTKKTFSLSKLLIALIIQLKLNSIRTQCDFSSCSTCIMCGVETFTQCGCDWYSKDKSCSLTLTSPNSLSKWYKELKNCDQTNEQSTYCSTKTYYTIDDFSDDKIQININKDENNKYGKYFIYCLYEFYDEQQQYAYDLSVRFNSEIIVIERPKIAITYYVQQDGEMKGNEEEISNDYDMSLSKVYNLNFMVLLKSQYSVSPITLTITKTSNLKYKLYVTLLVGFIFLILIFAIICCTTNYLNKRTREQLRLLRVQRDLENFQQMNQLQVIKSGVDQDLLKKQNTEKLNKLFETILVEHPYKKEYNQYGGGCSICLENFNKKSKVSITPCSHVFHYKCIHEWLFKNILCPKCPNCNNEVLNEQENKNNNINKIIHKNNNNNNKNSSENDEEENRDVILDFNNKAKKMKKKQNDGAINFNESKRKTIDLSSQNNIINNSSRLRNTLGGKSSSNRNILKLNKKGDKKAKETNNKEN